MRLKNLVHHRLPSRAQNGSVVLVVLASLVIMLLLVAANTAAINQLGREVKFVEKKQLQRLATSNNQKPVAATTTNTAVPSAAPSKP